MGHKAARLRRGKAAIGDRLQDANRLRRHVAGLCTATVQHIGHENRLVPRQGGDPGAALPAVTGVAQMAVGVFRIPLGAAPVCHIDRARHAQQAAKAIIVFNPDQGAFGKNLLQKARPKADKREHEQGNETHDHHAEWSANHILPPKP